LPTAKLAAHPGSVEPALQEQLSTPTFATLATFPNATCA